MIFQNNVVTNTLLFVAEKVDFVKDIHSKSQLVIEKLRGVPEKNVP